MLFQTNNNMFPPRNNQLVHNNYPRQPKRNNIQELIKRVGNPQQSLKSLATKSIGDIPKTLDNIQEVARIVQTSAPVIEKYAPIVKNIPTMYRLMKSINEVDDHDEAVSESDYTQELEVKQTVKNGQSEPKLFI